MKKRQELLTDEQWERLGPCFPSPSAGKTIGVIPGRRTGRVLKAFCGFYKSWRRGGSCPINIHSPRPVGDG